MYLFSPYYNIFVHIKTLNQFPFIYSNFMVKNNYVNRFFNNYKIIIL